MSADVKTKKRTSQDKIVPADSVEDGSGKFADYNGLYIEGLADFGSLSRSYAILRDSTIFISLHALALFVHADRCVLWRLARRTGH